MAKVGISQGNPLAALGNILRKGPGRGGSGRDSKSPRREVPVTKKPSFKESKESLREGNKDSAESSGRTNEPKSPKMFRFGIKRSSSRSKKGERDDSASDTSSVNSLNVLPVKEEPMEVESSGLTVSRSAGASEAKESTEEVVEKSASVSTSKSGNRNSTYFKPPEVEPLTDLFASGELDALLKTNDGTEKDLQVDTGEKVEKETEEEQPSNGSELKRNNLRSSFRMYENRYRAETLEKKKEKSPLSTTTSVARQPPEGSNDENVADSTASDSGTQFTKSDGDSTVRDVTPESDTEEESGKAEEKVKQEKENERRRRKLFDDELFPSDLPIKTHTRIKAPSAATPSLDAYAKAHRSPSPVAVASDGKDLGKSEADKSNDATPLKSHEVASKEEETQRISTEKVADEVDKKADGMSQEQQSNENVVPLSPQHSDPSKELEAEKDAGILKMNSEEKKMPMSTSPTPTHSDGKDQTVLSKTELEKESEEREAKKDTNTSEKLHHEVADAVDKQTKNKQTTQENVSDDKTKAKAKVSDDHQESPRSDKDSSSTGVGRKRREEKQQSPRSTRSNDARLRIQSGKVSGARSKFDSSSPSASPRMQRAKASTESSRLSSERKMKTSEEHGSKSLSWMSDLQKKKDQRTKAKETTTARPSTEADDEDMPDWRKRVLERRRKAAEANSKSSGTDGKADRVSRSGRYGETGGATTRAERSPRKDLSSNVRKSPSPSSSKISSTKATKSVAKETKSEVKSEAKEGVEDKQGASHTTEKVLDDGHDTSPDTNEKCDTKPTVSSEVVTSPKPEITSPKPEITSPKPEITSPKPRIDISTMKVQKRSSSSEQQEQSMFSIDVKPSEPPATDDTPEKREAEDEVFAPEPNQELPSTSGSPSNLQEKITAESSDMTGSRRSSNSSEKEVGMPFRSRGISHSRSPTPTSLTPGPLKLPADPGVPEWKKKVLERKKDPTVSKKSQPVSKSEPEVPAWKKELLAKRAKMGEEVNLVRV